MPAAGRRPLAQEFGFARAILFGEDHAEAVIRKAGAFATGYRLWLLARAMRRFSPVILVRPQGDEPCRGGASPAGI